MWKHLTVWSLVITTALIPTFIFASTGLLNFEEGIPVEISILQDDNLAIRLNIDAAPSLSVERVDFGGIGYDRVSAYLEPTTSMAGWPELPMISKMVLLPPTEDVELVIHSVESRTEESFDPFILPLQDGTVSPDLPGTPTVAFQQHDGFWPPDVVVVGEPAIIRGHRIATVTTFPVQYNPTTGQVRFNDKIDFELVYSGEGDNQVPDDRERHRLTTGFREIVNDLVENPLPRRDGPFEQKNGSYIIIYPDVNNVEEAIQPLIEWRARQGWEVHAIEVGRNANNNSIKDEIEEAYDDWENPPEMVTLVGDADGSIRIPVWGNFTDLDYVLLDGNDRLADAHIGRLSVSNINQLRTVVSKLVNYEADPYMGEDGDDTDWYLRGMACAGFRRSGLSTIMMNHWIKYQLLSLGYIEVAEYDYNDGNDVPGFFRDQFEEGVSFAHYRGWIGMEGTSYGVIMNFRRHRKYPTAIIPTCASGHFIGQDQQTEGMLRSEGGANGAVGFCTSQTHTKYNNAVASGVWQAFLKHGHYHWGAATNYGRYEIYRQYNGFDGFYANFMNWLNLMGDAATHIFTGVPQLIEVDHDETMAIGESHFTLNVFDPDEEVAMPKALVCLYKEDDDFQMTQMTDENGDVSFTIPTDALSEGEMMVTVTKHNTKPYLGTVDVEEAEMYLGAESWNVDDEENGDGDRSPNPGESLDIVIDLTNFGSETPEGEVTITASPLTDWIEVVGDPVVIDEAPDVGESTPVTFSVNINPAAPDESIGLLAIDSEVGDVTYHSVAALDIESPKLIINRAFFEGGDLERGDIKTVDFQVENVGRKLIGDFTATLVSESDFVSTMENNGTYDELRPNEDGRLNGDLFRVRAHPFAVPGAVVTLTLEFETEAGFTDQASIDITLGETGNGEPFGPDEYGYICFDSGDEDWEMAPVYDWIEIDPQEDDNDFNGTDTDLQDTNDEADESVVVDLPFVFQYYGERFVQLTICTNGWAAFGDWEELAQFRNRRIASGNGPDAQLCVFWDNLYTGKVLYHHDEENGLFIVEWNDMRRQWQTNLHQTFELILYDPEFHPTFSGDGLIAFQYKEFNNGGTPGPTDTPYATIGIGNLDDTDGLEYTYWNRFTNGATRLDDEMAIKFTTAVEFITGSITGTVRDLQTGEPIEGAWIHTSRGFADDTDENGVYVIPDVLIGDNYMITASAPGYNDSTKTGEDGEGYSIFEDEELTVDFDLLHPEFSTDVIDNEFDFTMMADSAVEAEFVLTNSGNGRLEFNSRFSYIIDGEESPGNGGPLDRDDPDDAWDLLHSWTASDSVDDTRIHGVVFTGEYWLVSGRGDRLEPQRWFYRFTKMGQYVDRIEQPIQSRFGIRGMEFYDGSIYAVARDIDAVFKIDPETGELEQRWELPDGFIDPQAITIDPDTEQFWVTGVVNQVYQMELIDDSLEVIDLFDINDPRNGGRVNRYGLAWFRDDPDGYPLYIMSNSDINDDDEAPDMSLFKMNPETDELLFVTGFPNLHPRSEGKGGIVITPKWNNLVWVLAAMIDNPDEGDYVGLFEVAPNSSWIDYSPRSGRLEADETQDITLEINTADLDTGSYGVVLEFEHNAMEEITQIPVELQVVLEIIPSVANNGELPFEYALHQNWPNPFNPSTELAYSLRDAGFTQLRVFDVIGREIVSLVEKHQPAGNYRISFDGSNIPAGIYFYRLESGSFKSVHKMVLVK